MSSESADIARLSYGDLPTQRGVIVETWPGGMRLTVPPPRFARLGWIVGRILFTPIIVLFLLLGAGDALFFYRGLLRVGRAMVIEVNEDSLSFLNTPMGDQRRDVVLPRRDVYAVKYVGHSGNLVVRAHGHEMLDWRPFRSPHMLEYVARLIREALGLEEGRQS